MKKGIGAALVFVFALGLLTKRVAGPTWDTATRQEILQVVAVPLRTPVGPSQDQLNRTLELDKLLDNAQPVDKENRARIEKILREGPAIARGGLLFGLNFADRGRMDAEEYRQPPYFQPKAKSLDFEILNFCELAAQRALQASTNLSMLQESIFGQGNVDSLLNDGLDRGLLSSSQIRLIFDKYFQNDEVTPALRRAIVGEFWETDLLKIEDPTYRAYNPLRTTDREGNYDALQSARNISAAYEELLRNCESPPSEAVIAVEGRLNFEADHLPTDDAAGKTGWRATLEKLKYRVQMRWIPNSFGIKNIQSNLDLENILDQPERADCQAAHRLLGVKLAACLYRADKGRSADGFAELVRSGYLKEPPLDPWSHDRLIFDASTRTVRSAADPPKTTLSFLAFDRVTKRTGLSFKMP